jgi:hypothetical protein
MLRSPEIARAVHSIVHLYAATVPSFKKLRLADVSSLLSAAAKKLRLVQSCSSRIIFKSGGADVTAPSNGNQVITSLRGNVDKDCGDGLTPR